MNYTHVSSQGFGRAAASFHRVLGKGVALALLALLVSGGEIFAVSETTPDYKIRDNTPTLTAFINALLIPSPGKKIEGATIVCESGKIIAVGAKVKTPAGARVIDLEGKTVYPGFIDAYTEYGFERKKSKKRSWRDGPKPEIERIGGNSWNGALHPEKRWIDEFKADKKAAKDFIEQGFTVVQSGGRDGIFRGHAFVATLGEGNPNDLTLVSQGYQFASFDKGSSKQDYPSSLMGSIALIRQTTEDADWYAKAQAAYQANSKQPQPEFNATLAALNNIRNERIVFETDDELSLLRAGRVASEFGMSFIYIGSGYEYARLDEIKALGAPIILPINYPKTPTVATLEDELDVTLAELRHWEAAPSNPSRLAEANVTFALTMYGLKKKDTFWKNLRKAVKRGLSADDALAAITTTPAELLGVSKLTGTVSRGKLANLVVTDGDIFDKKTKILTVWIAGMENEVKEEPPKDVRGTYEFSLSGEKFKLELEGKVEKLKGNLSFTSVDSLEAKLKKPSMDENQLQFTVKLDTLGFDGSYRFSARFVNDTLFGRCALADGVFANWTAAKTADYDPDAKKDEKDEESDKDESSAATEGDSEKADKKSEKDGDDGDEGDDEDDEGEDEEEGELVGKFTYPNMAFGYAGQPKREDVLIKNATVWTSDEAGRLEGADVLIKNGKIAQIGKGLKATNGIRVINATGKHLTPGIIDEHSHIAISKGVNECTEAITAEVRIGDVVNSDDISIYRQLSGGVTCSQLLHGSCNPIGGQAQVIKLRWGSAPEDLKFRAAPKSIKCALGENVKRSNFGDKYTKRYPQTRMGVETIMKDGFIAALENKAQWEKYNSLSRSERSKTVPPRNDIQHNALLDIINSEMFIHCHSYMQSEILMLMRLAEEFGFRIQTFTHILEGYKVADEMAKHGATASTFSDWWAYKFEVYDAIPQNAALMTQKGVISSINSDNSELARRLNQEAAKSIMYGDMEQEEALKLVTLNPAIQLKIDHRVGSITVGKDADFVIWNNNPLSIYAKVEQTWIEGRNYFNLERDAELREQLREEKSALVQKALASAKTGKDKDSGGKWKGLEREWHCDDAIDVWREGR